VVARAAAGCWWVRVRTQADGACACASLRFLGGTTFQPKDQTSYLVSCTTSVQLKMSNPQHSSGCGLRRAVGVWLYSIWIELKDLQ
jgi:hypothetical protein